MRAAIIASTIANVNRARHQRALKVGDFMPQFWRDARAAAADLSRRLRAAFARYSAAQKERDGGQG